MARYQVRGPHGSARDYARWTVVDTADRDIAVHTTRTKADAVAAARELNTVRHTDDMNGSTSGAQQPVRGPEQPTGHPASASAPVQEISE